MPQVNAGEVILRWSMLGEERVPTLRDEQGRLLYPYNEYLDARSKELSEKKPAPTQLKSIMDAATYALKDFCNFTLSRGKTVLDVNDELLREYAAAALESVQKSSQYRGNELKAKSTVNVKLRQVYRFLSESQKFHRMPKDTIGLGPGYRVNSTLPYLEQNPTLTRDDERMHPMCFFGIGSNRNSDGRQHWATEKEIDALEDHFWRNSNHNYVSTRNTLILRIGEKMGWRISTIMSLKISQFSEFAFSQQSEADHYTVTPSFQKRGHIFPFSMQWELAHSVASHIVSDRALLLRALGADESTAGGMVFLSLVTGQPLTTHSATEIIADGFKAIGAAKGSGSHSLRRFRGKDAAEKEIAHRRASGLSMAPEDIRTAVQEVLGHGSKLAQRSYTRAITAHLHQSPAERLDRRLTAAQDANAQLRAENRELLLKIQELQSRSETGKGNARVRRRKNSKTLAKIRE